MAPLVTARHAPVARRIEEVSGIRPVTLLIASGIVLITAILLVTGIAANQLRRQALALTGGELVRIDTLLAAATDRSLATLDAQLADVADRVADNAAAGMPSLREAAAAPRLGALPGKIGHYPRLAAVALVADDGAVVIHAGAWPTGGPWRDLVGALRAEPMRPSIVGSPVRDPQRGNTAIPIARRIAGPQGAFLGAAIGLVPAADFGDLFAAVPLATDVVITLFGPDGTPLVRYPEPAGGGAPGGRDGDLGAVFNNRGDAVLHSVTGAAGEWRIEALRRLADYPLAVGVSRSGDRALAGWARQGLWFGAFALFGAVAIGVMVYLIARQFQTHAMLAAMRVDRVEMERARFEAELWKRERLSVLGQLTATVAHELRNPLSAIRNTLFTVKEMAANAGLKLDRPIGRMERSIERCDRIISDLLEYTRARELKRSTVRFDRWLADLLAEQTVSPAIAVSTEFGAGDTLATLDADRIRRVVINLIENAAQALSELPPERDQRITVRTALENGQLVFAVEDTGPGIPPENLSRVFEPLFSTKTFGTGLGLPTVKQIVNQHRGIIAVDSAVGRGTRVMVRLPLQVEAIDEVKVAA
jgi:signal transduction histidine kinase